VLLEAAPQDMNGVNGWDSLDTQNNRLFVFSAKTEKSLTAYLSSFGEYLEEGPESNEYFRDLSYTLGQRRTHYPYRVAVLADSVTNLQESLSAAKPNKVKDRVIAFAFTGQGAQ